MNNQAVRQRTLEAANHMDWAQVVLNGGPPCFRLCDDGNFCGRAERWAGHGDVHGFISLGDLLGILVGHGTPEPEMANRRLVELCEAERDCVLSGNTLTPLERAQCLRTIDNIITRIAGTRF